MIVDEDQRSVILKQFFEKIRYFIRKKLLNFDELANFLLKIDQKRETIVSHTAP